MAIDRFVGADSGVTNLPSWNQNPDYAIGLANAAALSANPGSGRFYTDMGMRQNRRAEDAMSFPGVVGGLAGLDKDFIGGVSDVVAGGLNSLGMDVKGEDLYDIVNTAGYFIPGYGVVHGLLDSSDELYSGITGKDAVTGIELTPEEKSRMLGLGLFGTVTSAIPGIAGARGIARGLADGGIRAATERTIVNKLADALPEASTKIAENAPKAVVQEGRLDKLLGRSSSKADEAANATEGTTQAQAATKEAQTAGEASATSGTQAAAKGSQETSQAVTEPNKQAASGIERLTSKQKSLVDRLVNQEAAADTLKLNPTLGGVRQAIERGVGSRYVNSDPLNTAVELIDYSRKGGRLTTSETTWLNKYLGELPKDEFSKLEEAINNGSIKPSADPSLLSRWINSSTGKTASNIGEAAGRYIRGNRGGTPSELIVGSNVSKVPGIVRAAGAIARPSMSAAANYVGEVGRGSIYQDAFGRDTVLSPSEIDSIYNALGIEPPTGEER